MMKPPLVPADLFSLVTVGDPQLTPDARLTFFEVATFDREADDRLRTIGVVDTNGAMRGFTAGPGDGMPRVSPDGRHLAFVREGASGYGVFVMAIDGGEARALGASYEHITALEWSPESTRLAISASVPHDPATARIFLDEASGTRHILALPFKSDADGLLDGIRNHIVVLALADGSATTLTHGDFSAALPTWSPDGAQIAFGAPIGIAEDAFVSDIHVVDVASGVVRTVTAGDGPKAAPAFSPDGQWIACVGHQHGNDSVGRYNSELLVVSASGGAARSLSAELDRTIGDVVLGDVRSPGPQRRPAWTVDGLQLIVQSSEEGAVVLRSFALDGTSRVVAGGERVIFGFSHAADGTLAIASMTATVPNQIARIDGITGIEMTLTSVNAWLDERELTVPRRYRPAASDGTVLDAWLLVPATAAAKPPLVLEVHGGPHAAYGHAFFFEFQILAGAGMTVAYGNPRGSQSYGHAYADRITGDWGGIDTDDVLRILDGALRETPVDEARIGIAGGSYGGFMTTWMLGHSDRFAAGVSMRAVNDFVSEVGASDLGWFLETELARGMRDADNGRALFDLSPLRAAHAITAPLLIEHSERDYRCPIDQGEQLFTLLRRYGRKNVEFVRFTGAGHELSRGGTPRARVLRLRAIAHWLIRHLRPHGIEPPAPSAGVLFHPLPGEARLDGVGPI